MGVRSVARGYSNGEHYSDGGTNRAADANLHAKWTGWNHTLTWSYATTSSIKHNDNDTNYHQYCANEPYIFADVLYYSYSFPNEYHYPYQYTIAHSYANVHLYTDAYQYINVYTNTDAYQFTNANNR
jgi:hypothetical protein